MTQAAPQPPTDPAEATARSRVWCEAGGHWVERLAAKGMCWRDYQADRRATKAAPARARAAERLEELAAAYRRVTTADRARRDALGLLRTRTRLAYADGLSLHGQLPDLAGRSHGVIQRWLPAEQTAARHVTATHRFGGDRAPPEVVDRWRPLLAEAAAATDEAEDRKRDAAQAFRELLVEATAKDTFGRVGPLEVARRLNVTDATIHWWLKAPAGRERRCHGLTVSGDRCRLPAPPPWRTCGLHRDQEPDPPGGGPE